MEPNEAKRTNQAPVSDGKPDYTKEGWPSLSLSPFVASSWYKEAGLVPPTFVDAAADDINLSLEQAKRMGEAWQRPFSLSTWVKLAMTDMRVAIPGPQLGQLFWVSLPGYGCVIRTTADVIQHCGYPDTRHRAFAPIAPQGRCRNEQFVRIKRDDGTEETIPTCKFVNCPDHPTVSPVHTSIHQAYHAIDSIGEPHLDQRGQVTYLPDADYAEKQLMKFMEIDRRPLVHLWAAKRLTYLKTRESKIKMKAAQGQQVRGR